MVSSGLACGRQAGPPRSSDVLPASLRGDAAAARRRRERTCHKPNTGGVASHVLSLTACQTVHRPRLGLDNRRFA